MQVERVEIKDARLPVQLQRAMAAEAEAAREARAKVGDILNSKTRSKIQMRPFISCATQYTSKSVCLFVLSSLCPFVTLFQIEAFSLLTYLILLQFSKIV